MTDQPTEAPRADVKPLPEPAEWARGNPARRFRIFMEPIARAIMAEKERDEAEARIETLTAERATEAPSAAAERIVSPIYDHEVIFEGIVVSRADLERLTAERDDARAALQAAQARADGYALLVGELRAALVEHVEYDDGTFMRSFSRCMACCEDDRASGSLEHDPICLLSADPEARVADLLQEVHKNSASVVE